MAGSSREKVAGRPAGKRESGDAATQIFKGDRGRSKGRSKGKRARIGEEEQPSR